MDFFKLSQVYMQNGEPGLARAAKHLGRQVSGIKQFGQEQSNQNFDTLGNAGTGLRKFQEFRTEEQLTRKADAEAGTAESEESQSSRYFKARARAAELQGNQYAAAAANHFAQAYGHQLDNQAKPGLQEQKRRDNEILIAGHILDNQETAAKYGKLVIEQQSLRDKIAHAKTKEERDKLQHAVDVTEAVLGAMREGVEIELKRAKVATEKERPALVRAQEAASQSRADNPFGGFFGGNGDIMSFLGADASVMDSAPEPVQDAVVNFRKQYMGGDRSISIADVYAELDRNGVPPGKQAKMAEAAMLLILTGMRK